MRVLLVGVGDAFTRRHFSTSALSEEPGGWVLLDCPDLVHRAVREAAETAGWSASALDVGDVIVTHLHGDHCNGLESFGFAHKYLPVREGGAPQRPRLHTSRPAADRLWERLAPAMDGAARGEPRELSDYFELRVLEPQFTTMIAGLAVRCRFTTHPLPTIGLLISDGTWTLGWSGDTSFEPAHIDWLNQADVIVHESNVGDAHTPIECLNALPDEVRRKIRLVHLPDAFDANTTDIEVLAEGDVLG